MIIRTATDADRPAIDALERAIFPDDAWSTDMMRDSITNPHSHFLVAEDNGVVVGYSIAFHLPGNETADIHNIALDERYRGTGVGGRLFDAALEWSKGEGADAVLLEVRDDNARARALYESRGFHAISRRPGYYQPANVDAIVMRAEVVR